MGRALKRVPMDFAWPLGKVWTGYLNPHYRKCPQDGKNCFAGSTAAGKWIESFAMLISLAGQRRMHPYLLDWPQAPCRAPLTEDVHTFALALAGGREGLLGPDEYEIYRNLLRAAGLTSEWAYCKVCNGNGVDPAVQAACDAWTKTEPPVGEGFQLWETTTEGSPQSPVFATLDELCAWCGTRATTFGERTATADEWKQMLERST